MKNYKEIWKQIKKPTLNDHIHYCLAKAYFSKSNQKVDTAISILTNAFTKPKEPRTDWCFEGQPTIWGKLEYAMRLHNYHKRINPLNNSKYLNDVFENDQKEWVDFYDFVKLVFEAFIKTMPNRKSYVYFLIRNDLSREQKIVQAAHAAMELGYNIAKKGKNIANTHFVICSAANEDDLTHLDSLLRKNGLKSHPFVETGVGITAIGYEPIKTNTRSITKGLSLLRSQ